MRCDDSFRVLAFVVGIGIGIALRLRSLQPEMRAVVIHPAHGLLPRPLKAGLSRPLPSALGADNPEPPFAQSAPPATPPLPALPLDAYGECVERVAGVGSAASSEQTAPQDIVLAVLTTAKRHGLIEELRQNWLSEAKALFLTDAPGLAETANQKVVIFKGDPNCGAADRGGPAIHYAHTAFDGNYKWILHVDDDVLVSTRNLAAFLSAYNPDVPLWFSAHGCDASYLPRGSSTPPCIAKREPRGCVGCPDKAYEGLLRQCKRRGGRVRELDGRGFKGECSAIPGVQGLKTFGSEQGQSYCGGTGCVFSVGFVRSFPTTEIFRKGTACQGCTRGQQDVLLSRCLFHHNPAAIAPIGVNGFFWGRPGERLVEQMLRHYPDCLADGTLPPSSAWQSRRCVRQHGLLEWFTIHLQMRGACRRSRAHPLR